MIERQNLNVANALDSCSGTITRQRNVGNNVEKSVIDYVLLCDEMTKLLETTFIDEDQLYALTRYTGRKKQKILTKSDHNMIICRFSLSFAKEPTKKRTEC